jgi:hypothetical protein
MPKRLLPIDEILTLLSAAPLRIAALSAGLAPAELRTRPQPDEWSANDVLAYMRSCADVWGNCIAAIITHDRPTLRAIDPRTWLKSTDYLEQEFLPSLHAFAKQRSDLVDVLKSLAPESLSRTAIMTGAGRPIERSVLSFAHRLAVHERPHLKQIERIVKTVHT